MPHFKWSLTAQAPLMQGKTDASQHITLRVHNLNIMQRFIKFYFLSSLRRAFQLSWAVLIFSFFFFFRCLPYKQLRAHEPISAQICRRPSSRAEILQRPASPTLQPGTQGGDPWPHLPTFPAPRGTAGAVERAGFWSTLPSVLPQ